MLLSVVMVSKWWGHLCTSVSSHEKQEGTTGRAQSPNLREAAFLLIPSKAQGDHSTLRKLIISDPIDLPATYKGARVRVMPGCALAVKMQCLAPTAQFNAGLQTWMVPTHCSPEPKENEA